MANKALKGKTVAIPDHVIIKINDALGKYKNGGNTSGLKKAKELVDSKRISYERMKMLKTFFGKYNEKDDEGKRADNQEYELSGADKMSDWVGKDLEEMRDEVDHVKRTRMNTGEENQFKKTHKKDKSKNPTKIGMPMVHKGSVRDQITNNAVQYESYDVEIESMRYLIEYMDNNKKDKII